MTLPAQCFPDGVCYGILDGGRIVTKAFAHRTGVMEDKVCDVGIETAAAYRRRGYAKTALSALVAHFASCGGEAWYVCRPDNGSSRATARSVGFVPYGRSLVLAAPCHAE